MDKEELIKMGLTEEQAGKMMKAIADDYVSKSSFKEVSDELKQVKKGLEERDKQLDELKKSDQDSNALREKIEKLQAENKSKDEAYTKELNRLKADAVISAELTKAGARNQEAVKALLKDMDKAEFLDDGAIKGLKEQIEALMSAPDTGFLFEKENAKFQGVVPSSGRDGVPSGGGYEVQLAEARKNNDTLSAIKIKQQAASEGVVLI